MNEELIRIKRPRRLSGLPLPEILGIFVLDGSGSMSEEIARGFNKADAVSIAVRDLISRLKHSHFRNRYSLGIVNYDHRSVIKMSPTPVKDIDEHDDYNPMVGLGGGRYISEGLKDAKEMAESFLQGGTKREVVVMIVTDGVDLTQHETISIANTLKHMEFVQVAGCFFETLGYDADEMSKCADYVKSLCSSETLCSTVDSAATLRVFFAACMSHTMYI